MHRWTPRSCGPCRHSSPCGLESEQVKFKCLTNGTELGNGKSMLCTIEYLKNLAINLFSKDKELRNILINIIKLEIYIAKKNGYPK